MHHIVKIIGISVGLGLPLGCNIFSILPLPIEPLPVRPVVVATATPSAGQLRVTRAYTATYVAPPTASSAVTLTHPLGLNLSAQPAGVFIVVVAEVQNTGSMRLDLSQAEFTLADSAGHSYSRAQAAELALSVAEGPALSVVEGPALTDTAPLSDQTLPPNAQATGYLVFDVSPAYAAPLRLTARIPGTQPITSNAFTVED
ncbi:MAG TPA: DUF4352 domain-containing protein [Anaerolineae bacterium]|nr:DUF4352 domain-containing protein [Anaerolineae bacterium]HQI83395.1 DUF4352 domain-containing protein [Anaerolineae bacterium]